MDWLLAFLNGVSELPGLATLGVGGALAAFVFYFSQEVRKAEMQAREQLVRDVDKRYETLVQTLAEKAEEQVVANRELIRMIADQHQADRQSLLGVLKNMQTTFTQNAAAIGDLANELRRRKCLLEDEAHIRDIVARNIQVQG